MTTKIRFDLQAAIDRLVEARGICCLEEAETIKVANALSNAEYSINEAIKSIAWIKIHRMAPSPGMNIVKPHPRSQP